MNQVVAKLKAIITKTNNITTECYQTDNYELDSQKNTSTNNNSLSQMIQIESTIITSIKQDTHGNILDLSFVIEDLVNLIFKKLNEGKEESVVKKCILDYINNHKLIPQEIYNWLLNNQNDLNHIYLLGYFNYHGIETNINKQ